MDKTEKTDKTDKTEKTEKPIDRLRSRWLTLVIVVFSTFMSALDSSIVNVALPKMARTLGVETSRIQLVATSYLIVIVATVLIFGRLGDMLGKAKIFKFGLGLFTAGSLLCGIADTFWILILARGIQAIGAAAIMANNQGIITEAFPVSERGKALGFIGTSVALGALVGPGLGGLIVGSFSWQVIFLVNVPIGLAAFFLAIKSLPGTTKTTRQPLDGLGAILFIVAIVPLFIALGDIMRRGLGDLKVLLGLGLSFVAFSLFLTVEKRREFPLIQLKIFKNKLFSLSLFCGFVSFVALFCNNIILPFYLQDVMAYSPQKTGVILMIYPLILMVVAPVSGHVSDKIGSELLTFLGLLLMSTGLLCMSSLEDTSTLSRLILFIGIMSLGMGLFQAPNNSLIMSTVDKDKLGIAGSINALIRNLGMVSGITLATVLLYGMMSSKLGYQVTDYIPGRNDAFIYGLKTVYSVAGLISLFGAVLTFFRMVAAKGSGGKVKVK